jgi:hypothetical protein
MLSHWYMSSVGACAQYPGWQSPPTCNAAAGLVAGVKTGNNLRTAFSCVRDSSPPRGGLFPKDSFPPGLRGLPDWLLLLLNSPATAPAALARPVLGLPAAATLGLLG